MSEQYPWKDEPGRSSNGSAIAALEKVALAAIREQRATRRWKIASTLLFLILICVVAWAVFAPSTDGIAGGGRHTALVKLSGEISADSRASAKNITHSLDSAFAASNAAAVILSIDSPGGSPVQSGIIYRDMMRLRKKYPNKPLYVVVGDTCASGGYYVASAADKIFVDRASVIGSIGVIAGGFGFTGLMDKLGVERRVQTAGENKDLLDPFAPQSPRGRANIQAMLDQIHQQFIGAVREGRGTRLKETPDMFSGLVWTGEEGVKLGLADGFGDIDQVARQVVKADDIIDYTEKDSFTERVARRIGTDAALGAVRGLLSSSGAALR